ncbi:telomeric repeat-binding factor 2-interacting protein 1 [Pangasianodon hypophthalmus]|uniref:telomeric repeat-binding factor 2-interacting protein 1 n=1 Tax=Pangasianodon hypophthalmus TaxID=310915 RepID=UPI00147B5E2A|nr:telomeric repeat-binding factor 2-interacting protein 1 [Pangasianodon hypophthalmus]XP_026788280.2 telomeric repeat-binding factor 2-interacting protein 1 [Pangasianodon hypophthalmus]
MSVIKKESSATSAVLFLNVKGEPMRFFIRPGPTKVQLQPLISNGGGVLCRTQEPNAILLADPGDITPAVQGAGHFYISTQYIHDCVAQNQQLDIESYRFSNLQPVQTRAASRKQRGTGRMGYSLEDDTAILNFISKHQKEAKGNRIWQQMERQRITSHSWQSMKDRFLKHLQHKLEQKTPEHKKKVSPLKESSSSEDNISQPTPKKTPRKKAVVVSSSDSDATQISHEHEGGTREQPDLQPSPEEISSPEDPVSEKRQTDEVRKECDGDESVPEEERQHDIEQAEVSPKRARTDTDSPTENTSSGPNDQLSTTSEKQNSNSRKSSAPSGRKLGILERAAREFEDSQAIDGSQGDQPLSQASPINASDTDESQIMAARERALREQEVNPEHPNDAEEPAPATQSHRSTPGPDDDDPGPSSAALPITSNAHMFLFQQESQEELSQPSEEDQLSQSLLETKQHVVRLMQESKKDLVEVMKALLKASGDVTLALSYLLEGYDPEVHGPIWTRHDDEMLLSADSLECERLHEKYGVERVSKRAAFLKADL